MPARNKRGKQKRNIWIWVAGGGLGLLALLAVALALNASGGELAVGDRAPDFTLPSASGGQVSLADFLGEKHVLLFFSMTKGCAPCMLQIVHLQKDPKLEALDIALVSIGIDPLPDMVSVAQEFKINTPLLSDEDSQVSRAYGVLQWAMRNGEPGHTFVLVNKEGIVRWIKDYGAPENGGLMWVPVEELDREIEQALSR